jgi:hypothetical protein
MFTQSALLYPGDEWLVEGVPFGTRPTMTMEQFFEEVGRWPLVAGVTVRALRGAVLAFDFARDPAGLASSEVTALAAPDGFDRLVEARQHRLRIMNAFSLCLHTAAVSKMNLAIYGFRASEQDLIHSQNFQMGYGGPGMRRMPTLTRTGMATDFHRHIVIGGDTMGYACELLESILTSEEENSVGLASLLNLALCSYQEHDYSLGLVMAWTICEVLIQRRWRQYCEERATKVGFPLNRARRDKLDGRDYSASIVIEMLAVNGAMTRSEYVAFDKTRKCRNDWIHDVKLVDRDSCYNALELAASELSKVLGVELRALGRAGVSG